MGTQLDLFSLVAPVPHAAPPSVVAEPASPADPVQLLREFTEARRALSEAMIAGAALEEQRKLDHNAAELRRRHVEAFERLPDREAVAAALAAALGHKPHPDMLDSYDDLRRAYRVRTGT